MKKISIPKRLNKIKMPLIVLIFVFILLYLIIPKVDRLSIWKEKVNILILGTDTIGLKGRTDTIILVSLEPKRHSLRILSIPRDSLVTIPYKKGMRFEKINNIYSKYGLNLLLDIIQELTKEDILFYVVVDCDGLRNMVDIIGGIDLYISEAMRYTDRAGRLYINIPPGLQRLDGEKVLQYIRYRSKTGDIGRIERQHKIIRLFLRKLTKYDNPILTSFKGLRKLKRHVLTNLSLSDMMGLASCIKGIDPQSVLILSACGKPRRMNGDSYWDVDWDRTRAKWQSLYKMELGSTSLPQGRVRVRILNGCGKSGTAARLQARLRKNKGIDVLEIGSADRLTYDKTLIIDHVGKRDNASYVRKVLGLGILREDIDPEVLVDVTIIIGKDFLEKEEGDYL